MTVGKVGVTEGAAQVLFLAEDDAMVDGRHQYRSQPQPQSSSAAARLVGVDPSPGMIEMGRRHGIGDLQVGQAEALPLADRSVDLIVSTMSFHHWQDQAAGVREVARVLRTDGHFVLVDISSPALLARFVPRRMLTSEARSRLLTAAGLEIELERGLFWLRIVLLTVAVKRAPTRTHGLPTTTSTLPASTW